MSERPDYGVDAPGVIRNLVLFGVLLLAVAVGLPAVTLGPVRVALRPMAIATGAVLIAEAGLMLLYARRGKFRHRDRMLAMHAWRGDECVLDVGTGRGLLMIGAARRLTTGRATGIDIWKPTDLSGNVIERTRRNVELEGVGARCEVRSEDARKMSFPDRSFDLVLSNLCLHNIPNPEGRTRACAEIARVLKPGGRALISDFRRTGDYVAALRSAGLEAEREGPRWLDTFPPLRVVIAHKRAGA
jgi:SAM-dependent methyltransferase